MKSWLQKITGTARTELKSPEKSSVRRRKENLTAIEVMMQGFCDNISDLKVSRAKLVSLVQMKDQIEAATGTKHDGVENFLTALSNHLFDILEYLGDRWWEVVDFVIPLKDPSPYEETFHLITYLVTCEATSEAINASDLWSKVADILQILANLSSSTMNQRFVSSQLEDAEAYKSRISTVIFVLHKAFQHVCTFIAAPLALLKSQKFDIIFHLLPTANDSQNFDLRLNLAVDLLSSMVQSKLGGNESIVAYLYEIQCVNKCLVVSRMKGVSPTVSCKLFSFLISIITQSCEQKNPRLLNDFASFSGYEYLLYFAQCLDEQHQVLAALRTDERSGALEASFTQVIDMTMDLVLVSDTDLREVQRSQPSSIEVVGPRIRNLQAFGVLQNLFIAIHIDSFRFNIISQVMVTMSLLLCIYIVHIYIFTGAAVLSSRQLSFSEPTFSFFCSDVAFRIN
jgi:hypothetical protein